MYKSQLLIGTWLTALLFSGALALAADEEVGLAMRLNEGISQLSAGQSAEAEQTFTDLLETPDLSSRHRRVFSYYLGIAQLNQGKYAESAASLDQALRGLRPDTPEYEQFAAAHLDRGFALLMSDDPADPTAEKRGAARAADVLEPMAGRSDVGRMLLGIAQYRAKHYRTAVQTLEPLADPAAGSDYEHYAHYYIGLAEAGRGRLSKGMESLGRIRELPTQLGSQASQLYDELANMPEPEVKEFNWRFTLELGNLYDTNVPLIGDNVASVPDLPLDHQDDYRFALLADLNLDWQPQEGALANWHFSLGGTTFNSWHPSVQEYNVQDYAGHFYVGYKFYSNPDTFISFAEVGLGYDYDYALVGNNGFLSRNTMRAVLYLDEMAGRWRTTIGYDYELRDYQEDYFTRDFDRDGNYHSVVVYQEFDLLEIEKWRYDFAPELARYVTLNVGYRWENNSTQGDEYDYGANVAFAGITTPLPWNLTLGFTTDFEWQDYWQHSQLDYQYRERSDFIQRYGFNLSYKINQYIELIGDISWTENDSNVQTKLEQAPFSYDRAIYGLKARITFPG